MLKVGRLGRSQLHWLTLFVFEQSIAQTVKGSPEENAPTYPVPSTASYAPTSGSSASQQHTPTSEVNWLDDPETFKFLQSLGLMNSIASDSGIMPSSFDGNGTMNGPASNNPFQPGLSYEATWDPMSSFANNFSLGLDALEGTD